MNSIKAVFHIFWRRKVFIFLGGLVGLTLSFAYLAISAPRYTSTMLIAPATHGVSNLSDASSRNLSIAGTLFGSAQGTDFVRVMALMHSQVVAARLEENYHVIRQLYPNLWDEERSQWRKPNNPISRLSQWLNRIFDRPEWRAPDAEFLAQKFAKDIHIEQSENKGVYWVTYTARTPELAQMVLEKTYEQAELMARGEALKAASAYVAYLDDELRKATQQAAKQGLTDLYIQQEQRKMVLSADVPFAADLVAPPVLSQKPAGLPPLLILLFGAAAGGVVIFGLFLFLSRSSEGDEVATQDELHTDRHFQHFSEHSKS